MNDLTARDFTRGAVDDLVLLPTLDESSVLSNLKARYAKDLIHTYIGDVLVIVNPFKCIRGIYDKQMFDAYHNTCMHETAPHAFSIAQASFAAVQRQESNQCIVITGESGSGKTETAKRILEYLASVSGTGSAIELVQKQLVASNPILEAFGNAQTLRNDNSSRFGKYVEVFLERSSSTPIGANIQTFLLEKTRVVTPLDGERNFHIFYQLIAGMPISRKSSLHLRDDATSYRFLANNGLRDSHAQDAKHFKATLNALDVCGFTEELQNEIFKVLAAILWLGEVMFAPNESNTDSAIIVNDEPVSISASLLAIDVEQLRKCLVSRKWTTDIETLTRNLSPADARDARDALAKLLYERVFGLVVSRINEAMTLDVATVQRSDLSSISVLDVFGFEVHEKDPNSLEQLLINYFNERLHKMFIERTLRLEQEEYQREQIQWNPVDYLDNTSICELIERKHKSILSYVDECHLLKTTDHTKLLSKLNENLGDHPFYEIVANKQVPSTTDFIIKHYAGDVRYTATDFLEKNADSAWSDLYELGASSSSSVVKELFPIHLHASALERPATCTKQFKAQASELVGTMSRCQAQYIRCIKPNHNKRAGIFSDTFVKHQAKYLSLLENVRLRRAGFAFRKEFHGFLHRYNMLSPETWPIYQGSKGNSGACEIILRGICVETRGFEIGKTKVFIKEPLTLFALENARMQRIPIIVSKIQALWKGHHTRVWYKRELAARCIQRIWFEHTRAARALRWRSAIRIQRAARIWFETIWRSTLRRKATQILAGRKHRRKCSVHRVYVANYLPTLTSTQSFETLMRSHGENPEQTFFFDAARKLHLHNGKLVDRYVLLTGKALYVLQYQPDAKKGIDKLEIRRRWPIEEISQAVLSGSADNMIVLLMDTKAEGVKPSHDMCFEMERKTEFLAFLFARFHERTTRTLPVAIGDRIKFGRNVLGRGELRFTTASAIVKGTTPRAKTEVLSSGFRRLCIVVGSDVPISDSNNSLCGSTVGRIA